MALGLKRCSGREVCGSGLSLCRFPAVSLDPRPGRHGVRPRPMFFLGFLLAARCDGNLLQLSSKPWCDSALPSLRWEDVLCGLLQRFVLRVASDDGWHLWWMHDPMSLFCSFLGWDWPLLLLAYPLHACRL